MDRQYVGAGLEFLDLFNFSCMPSHSSHKRTEPQLNAFIYKHTAQIQASHAEAASARWQAAVAGESLTAKCFVAQFVRN